MTTTKKHKLNPNKGHHPKAIKKTKSDRAGHPSVSETSRSIPFATLYAIAATIVLIVTTIFWTTLGAELQQNNADQLVNTLLFEHWNTFQNATFPAAHSFLFKWPLLLLVRLAGLSSAHFILATAGITLATVGALAYILFRIDRRPLVFGSLFLALASVLLLVPPTPAAGILLPTNMAMLTTRNIEYILYIGSLILLIRAKKPKSSGFWLGVLGLAFLVASDRLFLYLSFGGALTATVVYLGRRCRGLSGLAMRWLMLTVFAAALAMAGLWLIGVFGLTHIAAQENGGPFSLAHNIRSLVLGVVFAGLNILTNFGANPAFDAGVLANFLTTARSRMMALGGISFGINLALFGFGAYMASSVFFGSFKRLGHQKSEANADTANQLSLLLLWSVLAAIVAFVVTDHYYAADARYLGIALFALAIAAATFLRSKDILTPKRTMLVGSILSISILVGLRTSLGIYHTDQDALANIAARNNLVIAAVHYHPVDVLVGDYWRVLPIKAPSSQHLEVMPLTDCTRPSEVLSSRAWQPDLKKHSFAYLLSLDKGLTDHPVCTMVQTLRTLGRPNSSLLISGTPSNPRELLLFYDAGLHRSTPVSPLTTIKPISLAQLPRQTCSQTIVNIVAHQDDDLLFMNPDLTREIRAGDCIRTIFITAGDAGAGQLYWLSREQGSERAYEYMSELPKHVWVQRTAELSDHSFITVANPKGKPNILLIFFHLPDGNINGRGFGANHYESLARLEAGRIKTITSVDAQSTYTSDELVRALGDLLQVFQPSEIHTQATYSPSRPYTDHSDHMAVGRYVRQAYRQVLGPKTAIRYYYGYPIRAMPQNVTGAELDDKATTFLVYVATANDAGCTTIASCMQLPTYGSYFKRQYSYTLTD